VAEKIAQSSEPHRQVKVLGDPSRANQRSVYVPATGKAREQLGLDQKISLEEGIRRTWMFNRQKGLGLAGGL
jgi:nucleoside-diphosphate-sugar epimerase